MSIIQKIKRRGYCSVTIRPDTFKKLRIESDIELEILIRKHTVSLRGWDFPHTDTNSNIVRKGDYIENETDWSYYKEAWRLYKSGMFIFIAGYRWDWLDEYDKSFPAPDYPPYNEKKIIPLEYMTAWITEFFTFASRLRSARIDLGNHIDIEFFGLKDRFPYSSSLWPFFKSASAPSFTYKLALTSEVKDQDPAASARQCIKELYSKFYLDLEDVTIRQMQEQIFRM